MLLLSRFKIYGHSMEPTLLNGSIVLVSSIPYLVNKPKIGDIVAFRLNRKVLIKRIVKINKEEKYFVKGDNEKDSFDSAKFGWIKKKEIVGKVIGILNSK